jgi:hypothetical protein
MWLHNNSFPRRTIKTSIQDPAKPKGATMRNITVAISDDSYRKARIWAAKNDTSVSAVVQDLLQNLPALARAARTATAVPDPYGKMTPPPSPTGSNHQDYYSVNSRTGPDAHREIKNSPHLPHKIHQKSTETKQNQTPTAQPSTETPRVTPVEP